MLQSERINSKFFRKAVALLIFTIFCASFLSSPGAFAEASITFSLDAQVGAGTIDAQSSDPTAIIYRSGNLTVEGAKNYQVKTTVSSDTLSNGSASLDALTEEKTLTEMAAGKWGLTILDQATDGTNVPTASSTYDSPSQTLDPVSISETTNRKLTFGVAAKVSSDQASGTYDGATLTISILAEDATADVPTMQTMTPEFCKSIPEEEIVTLVDDRADKKSYLVSRLKDGNCWMVQNLSLPGGTTITSADSDVSSDYTLPTSATLSDSTSNSSLSAFGSNTAEDMYDGTHQNGQPNSQYGYADGRTSIQSNTVCYSGASGGNCNGQNSGYYYTWLTATAQKSNNSRSGIVASSICPRGWDLPTGGSSGQFDNLYNTAYDGTPTNFKKVWQTENSYPGSFANGSLRYSGTNTGWWSSTISSTSNAYSMNQSSNNVGPTSNSVRALGFSVRCVYDPRPAFYKITQMHEMTPEVCDSVGTPGSTVTTTETDGTKSTVLPVSGGTINVIPQTVLADARDGKKYRIRKLADGKCWMTQNLAFGEQNKTYTLDPATTNVPSSKTYTTLYKKYFSSGSSSDAGYDGINIAIGSHTDNADDSRPTNDRDYIVTGGNTGNYYSFTAATAGYGTQSAYSSGAVPYDICPAGWHLPSSSSNNGEFYKLAGAYGATNSMNTNFASAFGISNYTSSSLVGYYQDSYIRSDGSIGYWWSRTVYSSNGANHLDVNSGGGVTPSNNSSRYVGLSIRCVAKPAPAPAMQDFTKEQCLALPDDGTPTVLRDARADQKEYLVAKLADGNCWMVQNLALPGGTTITSADSDLDATTYPDGYTLPTSSTLNNSTMSESGPFGNDTKEYMYEGTHQNGTANSQYGYANGLTSISNSTVCYSGASGGNCNGQNSGYYYSWLVATAQKSNSDASGNVASSICPLHWDLPTSNSGGQFDVLYNTAYSGNYTNFKKAWQTENSYTGFFDIGSLRSSGTGALWWSSTINGTTNAYRMGQNSSNVGPTNSSSRRLGFSVRCVFEVK